MEHDIAAGKATRGVSDNPSSAGQPSLLNIQSGSAPPSDAYAAVTYKGRWFWIADNDIRSKSIFSSVMLLFSISEVGIKSAAPVVTEVQLWQARVALERHGLAARAAAAIAASNDDALKAAWDYGNTISRASPGLAAIAAALSLDASAVDALFAEAATITV